MRNEPPDKNKLKHGGKNLTCHPLKGSLYTKPLKPCTLFRGNPIPHLTIHFAIIDPKHGTQIQIFLFNK